MYDARCARPPTGMGRLDYWGGVERYIGWRPVLRTPGFEPLPSKPGLLDRALEEAAALEVVRVRDLEVLVAWWFFEWSE